MIIRKVIDGLDDVFGGLVKAVGVPEEHAEKVKIAIEVVFVVVILGSMV